MSRVSGFLLRQRGKRRPHVSDILTYAFLLAGTLVMFGPVAWLVLSSFKTPAALLEFPPQLLPLAPVTMEVEGYDEPLQLFDVTLEDGSSAQLAQVRRIGLEAQMVEPSA